MDDTDCTTVDEVCDTDGLVDPDGGGYCVAGCSSRDDCRQLGYDCLDPLPGSGVCTARDYGDIGAACSTPTNCSNCDSRQGADDGSGMVCSGFCCSQHDCPPSFVCRAVLDGDNSAACDEEPVGALDGIGECLHDICVPIESANDNRRRGELCNADRDCRSNVCRSNRCADTCCTDASCEDATEACRAIGSGVTACLTGTKVTDLGELGCMTGTTSCDSFLCFAIYDADVGCNVAGDCNDYRNQECMDFDNENDGNDCVYDFCVSHCCSTADCANPVPPPAPMATAVYTCQTALYSSVGDLDICMIAGAGGTGAEGAACTSETECASGVCSAGGSCRERCCTDADCQNGSFPKCRVERHLMLFDLRDVTVCTEP